MPRGVLIDLGGVLVPTLWPNASLRWCRRLGISESQFLAALFGGNHDTVLIGKVNEDDWWEVVRRRLGLDVETMQTLRIDLDKDEAWDPFLLTCLGEIKERARTAILSNAWPGTRARLQRRGYDDVVHELVLSAEVGSAKPDRSIFETGLARLGLDAEAVMFIDDTPGHVSVAEDLGMIGLVHVSSAETIAAIRQFVAN